MPGLDPVLEPVPADLVTEVADTPDGAGSAVYDRSGAYRYRLSRVWDPTSPRLLFVMLNPSTASAATLDPTVARTVRWARSWGYGSLEVVNIFALRGTDPRVLRQHPDPVGPANDRALLAAAAAADRRVAAWGTHGELLRRGRAVSELFAARGFTLHCLGVTKDGHPRHPLYLPTATTTSVWSGYGDTPSR